MLELTEKILSNLDIQDEVSKSIRKKILLTKNNQQEATTLLLQLKTQAGANNCTLCSARHFHSLFLACLSYIAGDLESAQKYALVAKRDFYLTGSEWNEALARWLLGKTHFAMGKDIPARKELRDTITIFKEMAQSFRSEHNYEKRNDCLGHAKDIKEYLEEMRLQSAKHPPYNDHKRNNEHAHERQEDEELHYLLFPWVPVYEEVQAGADGPSWAAFDETQAVEISSISINNEEYVIHSLIPHQQRINLIHSKKYGWAPVRGRSMEKANIQQGDYILFFKSSLPQENGIVVASCTDTTDTASAQYMVKRYRYNILYSETTLEGDAYAPLNLRNCHILGNVIAVAKRKL